MPHLWLKCDLPVLITNYSDHFSTGDPTYESKELQPKIILIDRKRFLYRDLRSFNQPSWLNTQSTGPKTFKLIVSLRNEVNSNSEKISLIFFFSYKNILSSILFSSLLIILDSMIGNVYLLYLISVAASLKIHSLHHNKIIYAITGT